MATETETTQATTWQLDPAHTLVEFSAKHMMFTTVKGRFTGVSGTIIWDEANPSASSVEATIDAATIDTREAQRDGHLRSADFLDVENYPQITFTSKRITPSGPNNLHVVGDLTIHGTTREVVLNTTINGQGATPFGTHAAGFSAETVINRKDFGLTWNVALETGGFLVSDSIKISIEAEAVKQA